MKKIDRQRNKGLIERTYNREREEREKRETDMKNVNWKTEKQKSVKLKNIKELQRRPNETVRRQLFDQMDKQKRM